MSTKQSKLNRIMTYYTLTTFLLMVILPTFVTGVIYIQRRDALLSEMNRVTKAMMIAVNDRYNDVLNFSQELSSSNDWEQELHIYFNESYSQHQTHYLLNRAKGKFLPKEVGKLYLNNRFLESVQIVYEGESPIYRSTRFNTSGRKEARLDLENDLYYMLPIRSSSRFEVIAQLYMSFSWDKIKKEIVTENMGELFAWHHLLNSYVGFDEASVIQSQLAHNPDMKLNDQLNKLKETYFVVTTPTANDSSVIYAVPKSQLQQQILKLLAIIFLFCGVSAGVMYSFVSRQLRHYARQVDDILTSTSRIQKGLVYYRLNEENKEAELQQITKAINAMLDGQQNSMRKVYQLELENSEAVLKALQAQINPHFLYNTLEFIRMSAYLEGAESLAEFVYDFASLMRRNITQERDATISEELLFIEKYMSLYQARYPNKLALEIELDETLRHVIVPKFTLQPLVENYLVHGVDFSRSDNRVHIRVALISELDTGYDATMMIEITDNGRGMTQAKCDAINAQLAYILANPLKSSMERLGIALVAQRMSQMFGITSKMHYEINTEGGVSIWVKVPVNIKS